MSLDHEGPLGYVLKEQSRIEVFGEAGGTICPHYWVIEHQLANGDVVGGALTVPSTRLASPRYSLVLVGRSHLAQELITKKLDCNRKGLVGVFPSSSLATCHPVPWHGGSSTALWLPLNRLIPTQQKAQTP